MRTQSRTFFGHIRLIGQILLRRAQSGMIGLILMWMILNIHNIKTGTHFVSMYPVEDNGCYAVVRRFINAPKPVQYSKCVKRGTLSKELYLFHCDTIISGISAVHDRQESSARDNHFFVVKNLLEWLSIFALK